LGLGFRMPGIEPKRPDKKKRTCVKSLRFPTCNFLKRMFLALTPTPKP